MDIKKLEHRAVIKFLTKDGLTPSDIYEKCLKVYNKDCPSLYQVKFWAKQFKWGRESIEDDLRSGRPLEATTPDICEKIEDLILQDRRIKVSELSRLLQISDGSVFKIIHDKLFMSKVSSRWVPRMLTAFQRQARVECCADNLQLLGDNPDDFYKRIVTGDETWVHHWDPETKMESMQWKHKGSPTPKKFRTQPSAGKIMATIFWDCEGHY